MRNIYSIITIRYAFSVLIDIMFYRKDEGVQITRGWFEMPFLLLQERDACHPLKKHTFCGTNTNGYP